MCNVSVVRESRYDLGGLACIGVNAEVAGPCDAAKQLATVAFLEGRQSEPTCFAISCYTTQ